MWFLGIDIGTTHLKVAGLTEDGTPLPADRVRTPTTTSGGLVFHDAEAVWRRARDLAARYAATTAAPHGPLGGAAVASFGQEESVALDRAGRMLHPSLGWWQTLPGSSLDDATAALLDSYGHYRVSGIRHRADQTPERTAHLRRTEPGVWRSTARWADFCTVVTHRLTGEWTAASSQITHSQCFDVDTLAPDGPTLELLGLDPGLFAPVLPTGADAGALRPRALPGVALAPGARAVVGGHDQVVAARGVGAVSGARAFDSIGTSEYLMVTTDVRTPGRRSHELGLDHERSWTPDGFVLGRPVPSGQVVRLLADLLCGGDFDALFAALADAPGDPLPSLTVALGPGGSGGLLDLGGLTAGAHPGDVARRCLDLLADTAGGALAEMCAVAGVEPGRIALMGSLFRRPEMAAHRGARWRLPLYVSPDAEPVAHGAASVARDALLDGAGPGPARGEDVS
ncbi:FGGY family carbohydrate kinase [Streptomyces sp. NPDC050560]|uniref:FGGY family carbohydrate kinase n=1 Tax=Streptomyces sp. NPDC050560 TaxID=3365630 RepID=UPI00378BA2BE